MSNDLFESLRDFGVSQNDALCYALWLEKQSPKLPLRLENWVPTPLPIGYLGKDNQLVCLPFLDITKQGQVFGVMVGDMCLSKSFLRMERADGGDMYHKGFIGVNCELQALRNCLYPPHKNVVTRILASESIYARDPFIPNLNQMQQAYLHRKAFDDTLLILLEHGINVDAWDNKRFICRDDELGKEMQEYHNAVDFAGGKVVKWDSNCKGHAFVRVALPVVSEYDPPYPVDQEGCFDWTVWRKRCEPCFY